MPKVIIGVAGRMASGKGTVAKYILEHFSATRHGSSAPLRQVLDIFDVPQSRDNLRDLSHFLRETYGENTIANAVLKACQESTADIAIFDGMRRLIDIETFKMLPNFTFIFVDVDQHIRWKRCVLRNENAGDAEMTFEQFQKADSAEPEQQIDELKPYADILINNNGTPEEFAVAIQAALEKTLNTNH